MLYQPFVGLLTVFNSTFISEEFLHPTYNPTPSFLGRSTAGESIPGPEFDSQWLIRVFSSFNRKALVCYVKDVKWVQPPSGIHLKIKSNTHELIHAWPSGFRFQLCTVNFVSLIYEGKGKQEKGEILLLPRPLPLRSDSHWPNSSGVCGVGVEEGQTSVCRDKPGDGSEGSPRFHRVGR